MKPQSQFFMVIGLLALILGLTWISFSRRGEEPTQTFPATINRDCAPWDGSAFTVSIPMKAGNVIAISIWQSPDIKLPKTFSFPDETGQVGNAAYQLASGEYKQLSGTVFFRRVGADSPVEGRFELVTETGQRFIGQFKAEWDNQIIMCG